MTAKMLVHSVFTTPFGPLEIAHDEHFIFTSVFTHKASTIAQSPLSKLISFELSAYAADPHHCFQLPFKLQGTPHQQKVCNALLTIPVGYTLTYGELALQLQSSPRAIGQACKRNPLALFIPCHRVVGGNSLGGFMGKQRALTIKELLLQHELALQQTS